MIQSHDPRMNRLGLPDAPAPAVAKEALDQFGTYEVFHQKKEGAPFVYVGPVHAPEADVAFLFAKEQFSRRFACTGLWVVPTAAITLTDYVGDTESAYDTLPLLAKSSAAPAPDSRYTDDTAGEEAAYAAGEEDYDIFHLKKRGKAHQHVGKVRASSPADALQVAKAVFGEQRPVVNVWAARSADILRSDDEDRDIWTTTPEKKYRDAISYKVQDRIEKFKAENQ
ncbi:phenylacetic acid degradation b [Hymenobacter arizonensis]|uniref:Ring-1,2-phenylacetyl-CoA epoxidase subunit PaaB n=1 Tax=Hymenobacter arizonensis TaxID=1227077 RepID=A0A1I5V7Y5_HYMAR|nr:phenylacetic acid degradation b [Hymenobacter arizonensis]SFQ03619.1 ring-1,2-phenylacetyl-CoA epoxidase subunit PaaB [Hymenobacter arizonensis]